MKLIMKRKYLHIQIIQGSLHVYADDKRWAGDRLVTLEEMDSECNMHAIEEGDVLLSIPLNEFQVM